jgi:Mg-chelatase subunit ChlD
LKYFASKDGQGGHNASAWAFGIAIGIHIVVLCILAGKTLSRASAEDNAAEIPSATINHIASMSETPAIAPKPKIVETPRLAKAQSGAKSWNLPSLSQQYRVSMDSDQADLTPLASTSGTEKPMQAASALRPGRIEFFGNCTYDRKVCFVVDCSGSMIGLFGQVVRQLKQTIGSLEDDQYFYMIFYGGNSLHEYGGGKMVRATPAAKEAAVKFAQSVKPSGKTDAMRAIKRAMEIKDARGNKPAVIYFLTDGFELDGAAGKTFCKKIDALRQDMAQKTKINTVGIGVQKNDRPVLETIARNSGGQCVIKETK